MQVKLRPHHFQSWIDHQVYWRILTNHRKAMIKEMGKEYFGAFYGFLEKITKNYDSVEVEFIEGLDDLCNVGRGCDLIEGDVCFLDMEISGNKFPPRKQDEIVQRGYEIEMHKPYSLALLVKRVFPIIEKYATEVELANSDGRLKTQSNYDILQEAFKSFEDRKT